jgi:acyl-CoA thioesterase FadM
LSELGYFLPVYSYQVDIFEPLLAKDLFSVGVRPVSLQPSVFTFMHVIVKNERVVATSKLKHVLIDKVTKSVVTLEDRNLQLSFSKFHDLFGA